MAGEVDESLCAQLNSITGGTNSFVRVLTYTACDNTVKEALQDG